MTFSVSGVVFDVIVDASGAASLVVISSTSSAAKEFIAEVPEKGWATDVQAVRPDVRVGLPAVGAGYELLVRTYDSFGADLVKGATQGFRVGRHTSGQGAHKVPEVPITEGAAPVKSSSTTNKTPAILWLAVFTFLGVGGWYLLKPSDPCESTGVRADRDGARKALEAGDYVSALSKSNVAVTACNSGPRADELGRLQLTALNGVLTEGRRCLRDLDAPCLVRVRVSLAPMTHQATVAGFLSEFERDVGVRIAKDLEDAKRCIAKGALDCGQQNLRFPLTLRGAAAQVSSIDELLKRARTADDSARACLATDKTDCASAALENLRSVSPQSPIVMALIRRLAEAPVGESEGARADPGNSPRASAPATSSGVQSPVAASAPLVRSHSPPDIRVGDRWVLRTIDHANPSWSNTTERLVTEVSANGFTIVSRNVRSNYRRLLTFTPEWNLVAQQEPNGSGAGYTPPMQYLRFPLEPGKSWRTDVRKIRSDGSAEQVFSVVGEVQGVERVQVAAGTFDSLKVVLRIEVRQDGRLLSRSVDTSWYSPEVRRSVKTEEVSDDVQRSQQSRRSIELVEYSVQR